MLRQRWSRSGMGTSSIPVTSSALGILRKNSIKECKKSRLTQIRRLFTVVWSIHLLKGLIFCHECGYPMAVLNRPPVSGEDRLLFVSRTYQRFTKAGVCTCHSIKEQVVTEAVLAKVREVCKAYLDPKKLQPIAADVVEKHQQIILFTFEVY